MRTLLAVLAMAIVSMAQVAVDIPPPLEAKAAPLAAVPYPGWILPDPPEPLTKRQMVNLMFPQAVVDRYWLADQAALEYSDGLVSIPHDPDFLGVHIRTDGRYPIAEMEPDPGRKQLLLRLRKPAAGLLYLVAEAIRSELPGMAPPQLTSLVRSWEYQKRLMRRNPNADTKAQGVPATHVLGLAFDIGRAKMSRRQDQATAKVLDRLEDEGLLLYFLEGKAQAAYHVVAIPPALQRLELAYEDAVAKAAMAAEAANALVGPQ